MRPLFPAVDGDSKWQKTTLTTLEMSSPQSQNY
jgi:hypothetical protein